MKDEMLSNHQTYITHHHAESNQQVYRDALEDLEQDTILRSVILKKKSELGNEEDIRSIADRIRSGDQDTIRQYKDPLPDDQSDTEVEELLAGFQNYAELLNTAPKTIKRIVTECGYRKEDDISVRVFLLRTFLHGVGFGCKTLSMEPLAEYLYQKKLGETQKRKYEQVKEICDGLSSEQELIKKLKCDEATKNGALSKLEETKVLLLNELLPLLEKAIDDTIFEDLKALQLTQEETLEIQAKCLNIFRLDGTYIVGETLFRDIELSPQLKDGLTKYQQGHPEALAVLRPIMEQEWKKLAKNIQRIIDEKGNTQSTKDTMQIYRSMCKDQRVRKSKRPELQYLKYVELCDNLSKGRFVAGRTENRRILFQLAAMLRMETKEQIKRMFTNYYNDDILRYVFDPEYTKGESEPVGDGLNFKNYQEFIAAWFLSHRNGQKPGQILNQIEDTIRYCSELKCAERIERNKKRIRMQEEDEQSDPKDKEDDDESDFTWKREVDFNRITSKDDLISYVLSNLSVPDDAKKYNSDQDDQMLKMERELSQMEGEITEKLNQGKSETKKIRPINVAPDFWSNPNVDAVLKKAIGDNQNIEKTFKRIHGRLTRKRETYSEDDITIMTAVLSELGKSKGTLSKSTLKTRVTTTDAAITRAIKGLKKLGYKIQEKKDNKDNKDNKANKKKKENYVLLETGYGAADETSLNEEIYKKVKNTHHVKDFSRTGFLAVCALCYAVSEKGWRQDEYDPVMSLSELKRDFSAYSTKRLEMCRFSAFDIDNIVDRYVLTVLYGNLCKKE